MDAAHLIPLGGKRGEGKFAVVDVEDYDYLSQFKWSLSQNGYPSRGIKTPTGPSARYMHRDIIELEGFEMTDHINNDKLDNRRCNLRRCSSAENVRNVPPKSTNKTGLKGVSIGSGCFQANITFNRMHISLGHYAVAEDAARAYDKRARELYGEFAWLNFPNEPSLSDEEIERLKRSFEPPIGVSGYRGVSWLKRDKRWQARISIGNKRVRIGYYKTKEEAAQAYAEAMAKS